MAALLEGRVAIVTGGGRGIGRAVVEALAGAGAKVVVADNGTGIDGNGTDPSVAGDVAAALGANAIAVADSVASLGTAKAADGDGKMTDLTTDLEAFNTEPVV